MDFINKIKKYFPFTATEKDAKTLVVAIAIYLVVGIIAGAVIGLLSVIPFIGILFGIVGALVDLYCLVGIVFSILDFLGK